MTELKKLAQMSDYYGSDPTLVLAGGGNTSYKTADVLYVKASGFPLSGIREGGFAALDRHGLQDLLLRGYPEDVENIDTQFIEDVMATRLPGEEKRPSVEALLHHGFDFPYVLHLHPTVINSLTSAVNGKEEAERLFGQDQVWVKLVHPGYGLARYCWDLQQEHKAKYGKYPRFLFLQNHGIFIPGNSPEEIGVALDEVISKIKACYTKEWDADLAPINTETVGAVKDILEQTYASVLYCGQKSMVAMCESREAAAGVLRPYNPDQITYCRSWPLFCESVESIEADLKNYSETIGGLPKVIIVRGVGLFTAGSDLGEADRAMQLFLDAGKIAFYAEAFGGYHQLDDDFIDFIDNWEVENYRRGVANKNL
ncbi:MAG: class II aldolase/adducin family protein [Clostridia bacterium]|nr:class II aldolase/adducin family protein [Clostridia bacterium]